ncbi:LuxS/MPP-like metallohydrolase [Coemansia reversa NRRL 1564]|uniref:LuxS/MPP-like metallohydrolase n=1 Tax=Coemansia reversa (strain ATCC 12441 / NRRL 1564) TaxID=763665 RepID=A0A2G5B8V3_COERN|nr:LuxS/MPP-like metallohydrolase [Coemansia reversa NRRL 1564]|eukprot:PIA15448.1 LuxS/MPP-like metallohydrolase [Coemansia reversa NRRL 1564]
MRIFDVRRLPDWETGFETRFTVKSRMSYKEYTCPLKKSANDNCQYRLLRLPNNMVVICISDPNSKTAAAALTVGVGSHANPNDALGLAHLLERMLLKGTAKHSANESFEEFILNHSGTSNAFTDASKTSYYFDIANDALDDALERMSNLFIKPLLSAEVIGREVNIIDSEYQSQLKNDGARINGIQAYFSNPDHPHSQFAIGNKETLDSSNPEKLRKKVVKFYNRYYSADIMKLAITGSYSLDELTEMAVNRFSAVKSKGITKPFFAGHPLTKNELGKVIHFETLEDINAIWLTFPLPDICPHNRSRPVEYIRWLINHEGPGSLTQYLYLQGLAIYTAATINSYEGYVIFDIYISATPKGLKQYDKVVSAVFSYLRMISKSGPQEWIYNEISDSYRLEFDYYKQQQPMDYVFELSCNATNDYIPPEYIVSDGSLMGGFNSLLISAAMNFLGPTNYSLFIGAQSHRGIKLSNTEKYYNVRYHVVNLPNKLTTDFRQDNSMLNYFHLPKPNDFFPDDFSMAEPICPRPKLDKAVPTLLKYNNSLELWHKQDDKFYLPKGVIKIEIKSPVINSSPRNRAMFDLLCECWRYNLTEKLHSSTYAGLSYSTSGSSTAVNVTVEGFSQKLPLLLERVISNMRHGIIKESIFNECLTRLQQGFSYIQLNSAINQAFTLRKHLLLYPAWDSTLVEKGFKRVTYEMLNRFLHMLFEQVHITMFVIGNLTEQQTIDIAFNLQKIIDAQTLLICQIPYVRLIQLDPGYYILQKTSLNERSTQSATITSIQLGKASDIRTWVTAIVLHDIINKSFFDQLHTKEQLGNIVISSTEGYTEKTQLLELSVEGKSNPIYLSLRITEFLRAYRQHIVDLDERTLDNTIKNVIISLQEQLQTISSEAIEIWSAIESGNYNFERTSEEIEYLKKIGKQDIIEMWDKYINPDTAPQYTPPSTSPDTTVAQANTEDRELPVNPRA